MFLPLQVPVPSKFFFVRFPPSSGNKTLQETTETVLRCLPTAVAWGRYQRRLSSLYSHPEVFCGLGSARVNQLLR